MSRSSVGDRYARLKFWVHDYQPLPATLVTQVVFVIGLVGGILVALPFTLAGGGLDGWTVATLVVCGAVAAAGVAFLRLARLVWPPRWMSLTALVVGILVGLVGQVVAAG